MHDRRRVPEHYVFVYIIDCIIINDTSVLSLVIKFIQYLSMFAMIYRVIETLLQVEMQQEHKENL